MTIRGEKKDEIYLAYTWKREGSSFSLCRGKEEKGGGTCLRLSLPGGKERAERSETCRKGGKKRQFYCFYKMKEEKGITEQITRREGEPRVLEERKRVLPHRFLSETRLHSGP